MSNAAVYSRAQLGLEAPLVTVETHLTQGLPGFTLVGLPAAAVREARDRVRSAIVNSGFRFPRGKVIVNLAPGDLAKEGPRYDLAIAASVLCATGQLTTRRAADYEFLGELSLDGSLRGIRGSYCAALASEGAGTGRRLVLPGQGHDPLLPLDQAPLLIEHLKDLPTLLEQAHRVSGHPALPGSSQTPASTAASAPLYGQIVGHRVPKRALVVAAAGAHHLLLVGPPGTGKSLLARALRELLPPLTASELRVVASIYSAANLCVPCGHPPFREPHHSASAAAMIGGGRDARPGELTLAHHGLLFLDELPHFQRNVLELLREPMSSGAIALARAAWRITFPAQFQLVAAMNPCPAGGHCQESACRCEPVQVRRYQARISGPLLDRIDLQLNVAPLPKEALLRLALGPMETSAIADGQGELDGADLCAAVAAARARQVERQGTLNGAAAVVHQPALPLARDAQRLLERMLQSEALSARGATRILAVACTIADLDAARRLQPAHLSEAFSYRRLTWGGPAGMAGW
ncbi:MAG: YifB family Mg chelatase-like AAA ATPase [Pseudomonadota bacterium]